ITPPTIYRYDLESGASTLVHAPRVAFDPAAFEQRQVFYPAHDGTRIPMLLAYRKGLKLHGDNPLLLYGYGGFGLSSLPLFNASRIAWLEMGGVFAIANIRGGGEYGEVWRSEEHTSELQSLAYLVCRLLLEKKKKKKYERL